jgi:hypothetical protein
MVKRDWQQSRRDWQKPKRYGTNISAMAYILAVLYLNKDVLGEFSSFFVRNVSSFGRNCKRFWMNPAGTMNDLASGS